MSGRAAKAVHHIINEKGGFPMADQYKCKKCGKTSAKSGSCCGQPMEKVS